ncbi:unnamed protein product [Rhizophagus irregularis]|nr:unnamed protein product [Rhizophagus irregularis]
MLKHLKEECFNISEEFRNILYDSDNIIIRQKNKRSRVEAELSDDDNDENVTHHNKQNLLWIRAYKEVGMEFGTDKWIGFVSDNGPDVTKAQCLMREVS